VTSCQVARWSSERSSPSPAAAYQTPSCSIALYTVTPPAGPLEYVNCAEASACAIRRRSSSARRFIREHQLEIGIRSAIANTPLRAESVEITESRAQGPDDITRSEYFPISASEQVSLDREPRCLRTRTHVHLLVD